MGCNNPPTSKNIREIIDWHPVPTDARYEEKIVQYTSGEVTRMTRVANQPTDPKHPDYPHYTQFYDEHGHKDPYVDKKTDREWDAHHSGSKHDPGRYGVHKTAQAVLDDLDAALRTLRSSR